MRVPQFPDKIKSWLAAPLPRDVSESLTRLAHQEDVHAIAVLPDVHLASHVCVGTVVATTRLIYPAAVGSDLGCGMTAVAIDTSADLLANQRNAAHLLSGLYELIPSRRHSRRTLLSALPPSLAAEPLSHSRLEKLKSREGHWQLGTLGRGNHFIEFQADPDRQLWLLVHSGSRVMGQAITAHHLKQFPPLHDRRSLPALDAQTPRGQAYLHDVQWALGYAQGNRLAMVHKIADFLAASFQTSMDWATLRDHPHNHVRLESHRGEQLWVHRKGSQSAREGEPAIISGTMGTPSFHVEGRGNADSLHSCSHGAGRRIRRGEAHRRISASTLQKEMRTVCFDRRYVNVLRDEAPSAYKDIRSVVRAQRDLIRITREMQPLLNFKGAAR